MSVRSNGAVYLANNTFLGVSSDEPRCAFLVSDHLSTPTAQLPLNRPFAFDIRTNVESAPYARRHLHRDPSHKDVGAQDMHQHAGRSSSDGRYVAFLASTSHHHGLLDVATGHMTGFSLEGGRVLAAAWHPGCDDYPHAAHYLALLLEGGIVCILDAASQTRGVDIDCVSVLQCSTLIAQLNGTKNKNPGNTQSGVQTFPRGTALSRVCRRMASPIQIPSPADTDIIGLAFSHSTLGLPTMMLLLSRRGDVYSVKVDDVTMQPAPDALTAARYSVEDGQFLRIVEGSPRRNRMSGTNALVQDLNATVIRSDVPPPVCVHHVLRPQPMPENEPHGGEAVTITSTLVERREGIFVLSVLHSSGTLRCYRVTEKDLLTVDARHAKCYAQLPLSSVPLVPTNAATTFTQSVYLQQSGPLSLYRFPGNHVFLVSLPVCEHQHGVGTSSWVHHTGTSHSELPELSNTRHEMPSPLAARIAFDLEGYSLALSPSRVLAFPERVRCKGVPVRDTKEDSLSLLQLPILSLRTALLLKSAVYATAGGVTSSTGLTATKPLEALMKSICSAHALLLGEATEEKAFQRLLDAQGDAQNISQTLQSLWSDTSKDLTQALETEFGTWNQRKQTVGTKETALRAKMQQLRQRSADSTNRVAKLADFFWDGCVVREGVEAVYEMNRKLGKIHEVVSRLEAELGLKPLNSSS